MSLKEVIVEMWKHAYARVYTNSYRRKVYRNEVPKLWSDFQKNRCIDFKKAVKKGIIDECVPFADVFYSKKDAFACSDKRGRLPMFSIDKSDETAKDRGVDRLHRVDKYASGEC